MGLTLDALNDNLTDFVTRQHLFFVATAPSGDDGHVNVSPKGLDGSFRVLDPTTVAYVDLGGSGIETTAHIRQNGRVTLMFCAFEGKPLIVRLYGRGETLLPDDPAFAELRPSFRSRPQVVRSIIVVRVDRVTTSCGYAVPLMDHVADRPTLVDRIEKRAPERFADRWAGSNTASVDGLPGLDYDEAGAVAAARRQLAPHGS
jgi:predicted pyridoxine 5'-phosphate oxidase superfamily flavin-nucleotide-binding protein